LQEKELNSSESRGGLNSLDYERRNFKKPHLAARQVMLSN
jgi:hypothetical protein